MTRRQAERIMQMPVVELPSEDGVFRFEARSQIEDVMVRGRGATEKEALKKLVDNNYKRVSGIVMLERARGRCEECGKLTGLHAHHIKHRSSGRVDSTLSIRALCPPCHDQAHRQREER
jgi:5-methylcytosine-specific restriction endonuclease McrA